MLYRVHLTVTFGQFQLFIKDEVGKENLLCMQPDETIFRQLPCTDP